MTTSRTNGEEASMNGQRDVEDRSRRPAGDDAGNEPLAGDLAAFECERLALFARYGFEGESRWVADREGRRTYMIGRGEGPCPTMLVHGGLSQASEWVPLASRLPGHGDADVFAPPSSGHDMAARMPDAHLEVIADAGHLPYLDRPDTVATSIIGFISKE